MLHYSLQNFRLVKLLLCVKEVNLGSDAVSGSSLPVTHLKPGTKSRVFFSNGESSLPAAQVQVLSLKYTEEVFVISLKDEW